MCVNTALSPDSSDSVVGGCVRHTHWPAESSVESPISSKHDLVDTRGAVQVWPVARPPVRKVMNDQEGKNCFPA